MSHQKGDIASKAKLKRIQFYISTHISSPAHGLNTLGSLSPMGSAPFFRHRYRAADSHPPLVPPDGGGGYRDGLA